MSKKTKNETRRIKLYNFCRLWPYLDQSAVTKKRKNEIWLEVKASTYSLRYDDETLETFNSHEELEYFINDQL